MATFVKKQPSPARYPVFKTGHSFRTLRKGGLAEWRPNQHSRTLPKNDHFRETRCADERGAYGTAPDVVVSAPPERF
jgi:hypothetical protein